MSIRLVFFVFIFSGNLFATAATPDEQRRCLALTRFSELFDTFFQETASTENFFKSITENNVGRLKNQIIFRISTKINQLKTSTMEVRRSTDSLRFDDIDFIQGIILEQRIYFNLWSLSPWHFSSSDALTELNDFINYVDETRSQRVNRYVGRACN